LFSYALDRIGDYRVNIKLLDLLGKHKMNSGDVASTINDAEQRNLILEKYPEFKSNAVIGLNSDIKAFKEIDIKLKAAKTTEEAERLLEYSYAEVIKSAYERATAHFKLVARFDSEIMPGVSARDASEVKRLYAEIVIENYFNQDKKLISCDEFKARLSSYEKVVSNIGELDVFEGGEQRKSSAQNSRESLENFIMEEVVENGVKAEEVEASVLAEYEKVKQSASVTINVNETRIEGIYKDGEYKVYSELENKSREESLFGKTDYLSRRVAMDQKIADGQRFVVGCLASENGHDEVIGPAPFYGHGVITLKPESIDGRVVFFEGDSMTAKDVVDVTKFTGRPIKIVPQWLLRKWDNLSSRKLDFESAIFSKALMESYLKRRDLTHMHLMYVEAHVLAPVKVEDFKSVKYGLVGKDTADKQIRLQALGEKMQQIRPTAPRLEVKEFKGTIKAADKLPTYGEGHEVKKLSNDKGF
ncbi:hypothetical protein KBC97_01025, partial [Candidatus Gracilibacteria bacterium]|nr:hypothetical protein [Candidatus Gracilibacteria bacterium]